MRIRFNLRSLLVAFAIFLIEVSIALFFHDRFVRPYLGDVLVVVLIYYAIDAFVETKPFYLAAGVFAFACLIETAQYFHIVDALGLSDSAVARTVIGTYFEWGDIAAYFAGAVICLLTDRRSKSRSRTNTIA